MVTLYNLHKIKKKKRKKERRISEVLSWLHRKEDRERETRRPKRAMPKEKNKY